MSHSNFQVRRKHASLPALAPLMAQVIIKPIYRKNAKPDAARYSQKQDFTDYDIDLRARACNRRKPTPLPQYRQVVRKSYYDSKYGSPLLFHFPKAFLPKPSIQSYKSYSKSRKPNGNQDLNIAGLRFDWGRRYLIVSEEHRSATDY